MALAALIAAEAEAADRLGAAAEATGAGVISSVLTTAARLAVIAVQQDGGGGALGEPAADLRALRTDSRLLQATRLALSRAGAMAEDLIREALRRGYSDDLRLRAAVLKEGSGGRLVVTVSLSEQDEAALADYPIQGHTAAAVAEHLVRLLDYALSGALALPLTGALDPEAIPAQLGAVADAHGARLAGAVREAYQAGVQAGTKAITALLTGGSTGNLVS